MAPKRIWNMSLVVSTLLLCPALEVLTQPSRVDLNPVTSDDSNPDDATLPLETDPSHRRRSAFRDILSLRQRPNASTEERIIALRRLREQRITRSAGDVAQSGANTTTADDAATATTRDRRSRRMSARISTALHGRSRMNRDENTGNDGEESPAPRPRDEENTVGGARQ